MKILRISCAVITLAVAFGFVATAQAAGVAGKYKRPNGKTATVSNCAGGIRAVADNGTVMFACAKKKGGAWKSSTMKHPEFPGTFDGTVTKVKGGLNVQGCFGFICPSEKWTKQ